MKKQVQQVGVRKWFGDDFINIQNELFDVLEGFFGASGQQFILSGCVVAGNNISAGIVGLIDGTGFHLCRFAGVQGTAWPVYLYPSKITETRAYLDNQVKSVSENWTVATSGNNPGGYLQLKQDGTTARFFDAIQTASLRFVTDAEKTVFAGQAEAAITTLRGGVSGTYDTLKKLADAIAGVSSGPALFVVAVNTLAVSNATYVLTASLTLTLPAAPAVGAYVKVSNRSGVLTCVVARNGLKIMGLSEDLTLDKLNVGLELEYSGVAQGWIII